MASSTGRKGNTFFSQAFSSCDQAAPQFFTEDSTTCVYETPNSRRDRRITTLAAVQPQNPSAAPPPSFPSYSAPVFPPVPASASALALTPAPVTASIVPAAVVPATVSSETPDSVEKSATLPSTAGTKRKRTAKAKDQTKKQLGPKAAGVKKNKTPATKANKTDDGERINKTNRDWQYVDFTDCEFAKAPDGSADYWKPKYSSHVRTEKENKGNECLRGFWIYDPRPEELVRHKDGTWGPPGEYLCSCGIRTTRWNDMNRHIALKHYKAGKYPCPTCPNLFANETYLQNTHIPNVCPGRGMQTAAEPLQLQVQDLGTVPMTINTALPQAAMYASSSASHSDDHAGSTPNTTPSSGYNTPEHKTNQVLNTGMQIASNPLQQQGQDLGNAPTNSNAAMPAAVSDPSQSGVNGVQSLQAPPQPATNVGGTSYPGVSDETPMENMMELDNSNSEMQDQHSAPGQFQAPQGAPLMGTTPGQVGPYYGTQPQYTAPMHNSEMQTQAIPAISYTSLTGADFQRYDGFVAQNKAGHATVTPANDDVRVPNGAEQSQLAQIADASNGADMSMEMDTSNVHSAPAQSDGTATIDPQLLSLGNDSELPSQFCAGLFDDDMSIPGVDPLNDAMLNDPSISNVMDLNISQAQSPIVPQAQAQVQVQGQGFEQGQNQNQNQNQPISPPAAQTQPQDSNRPKVPPPTEVAAPVTLETTGQMMQYENEDVAMSNFDNSFKFNNNMDVAGQEEFYTQMYAVFGNQSLLHFEAMYAAPIY